MSRFAPSLLRLTPEAFWQGGRLLLSAGLAFGLLLLGLLTWKAPEVLPFIPVLVLGGVAAWLLFQHPLLNLSVLLAASVIIADYEAGIQFTEALYGLYLLGFLGHWFVTRLFLYRDPVLDTAEAKALLLFLVLLALSPPLTILFGGSLRGLVSEAFALSMLALYFPVKEACTRYRHGVRLILLTLGWVGLFVALRNFLNYQEVLLSATQEWQVLKGRAVTNDSWLMVSSLGALVLLIFAHQWRHRLTLLGVFLLFFAGLILTQSRGYWLAFLAGGFVMLLLVERRYRGRLVLLGAAGLVSLLGLGVLFFGDYVSLILGGLLDRFASLGTAASTDLSLVNRFYETKAVWARVVQNPILGHGMGVSYYYYDLTHDFTRTNTFIHNGYVSLWFKFGIWGLGLMLFVWLRSVWRGVQVFRLRHAPPLARLAGLAAALALAAFTVSANTSNPFFLNDTTFMFGVLMGLAGGAYARAEAPA